MVVKKRTRAALLAAAIATIAPACHAQNTTDWLANTYGTLAAHVGNTARSIWVAPEGVIYTASNWDEYEGGVAIYQNHHSAGSIGIHNEFQGSAITGNATSIFVALQYNRSYGSGAVGRYNRTTKTRDLFIQVSASNDRPLVDVITGLTTAGSLLYASDFYGNRVRIYTIDGVWQRDIDVSGPGSLALDGAGNVWVARKSAGAIDEFGPTGALLNTIQMPSGSLPSALYFDASAKQLLVGDEGPDMNIKRYNLSGRPTLADTFGVQGGYLDTTTGIKGQVGAKRFTRVTGIGKDTAGNLYVLNNPWGGSWDLGRNGGTDIHAYDSAGNRRWTLQSLNFEGIAAPDPATDGALFYGGTNLYSGGAGGTFVANTVDPFTYPSDPHRHERYPARRALRTTRLRWGEPDPRGVRPKSADLLLFPFQRGERLHRHSGWIDSGRRVQYDPAGHKRILHRQQGRRVGRPGQDRLYLPLPADRLRRQRQADLGTWHPDPHSRQHPAADAHRLPRGQRHHDSRTRHRRGYGLDVDRHADRGVSRLERGQHHRAQSGDQPHPRRRQVDRRGRQLSLRQLLVQQQRASLAEHRRLQPRNRPSRRHAGQHQQQCRGHQQRHGFDVRHQGVPSIDGRVRRDEEQRQGLQHHRLSLDALIGRLVHD